MCTLTLTHLHLASHIVLYVLPFTPHTGLLNGQSRLEHVVETHGHFLLHLIFTFLKNKNVQAQEIPLEKSVYFLCQKEV